jgi:alkylation response protein AidB-like acyl-CoA dehydrogenase
LPTVREQLFGSSGAAAVMLRQILRTADATPWQAAAVLNAACESAIDACAAAVQSHGGYGYLTEYPVERLLRDAVSLRAACDTAGIRQAAAVELATL